MPMRKSAKLGAVSALLLASIFIPPYANWREPINFASVGVSCVLGLLAAQQGSRWWLTIPCLIIVGLCSSFTSERTRSERNRLVASAAIQVDANSEHGLRWLSYRFWGLDSSTYVGSPISSKCALVPRT